MAACPVGRVPPDMRKDGYFMKSMKRRLLSLFMAMVMVCSLVPTALAADLQASISGINSSLTLTAEGNVTANPSVSLSNNTDNYNISTYGWSVTPTTGASVTANESGANPTITFTQAGTYTVTVSGNATRTIPGTDGGSSTTETKTYEATASVTVNAAPTPVATTITFDPTGNQTLTAGGNALNVTATVKDQNGNTMSGSTVTWGSVTSTALTASTSGNTITLTPATASAVSTAQDVTITASVTGTSASASFKVTVNPVSGTISLDKTSASLVPGNSIILTATPTPASGLTVSKVEWSSSSTAVTVTQDSADANKATVLVAPATTTGEATITAKVTFSNNTISTATCKITIANPLSITANRTTLTSLGDYVDVTASHSSLTPSTGVTYEWTSSNSNIIYIQNGSNVTARLVAANTGRVTITLKATINGIPYTTTRDFSVDYKYSINPTATVYSDTTEYLLSDEDDLGKKSVYEQIEDYYLSGSDYVTWVRFTSVADTYGSLSANLNYTYYMDGRDISGSRVGLLSDVAFIPKKVGTASFPFEVGTHRSGTSTAYTGLLTIKVEEGSSTGDIVYSASLGEDVYFNVSDFEDFYTDEYNRGYLEYVTFGSSTSNGTLYNEDGKAAGSSSYYVEPRRSSQKALDGIYFSPKSSMKKSTTVKISFTAHGTEKNDTGSKDVSGTVTIIYLNDSAKDITYSTTAGKVTLDPQDFIDAYKEATGSRTAPSNLTIEFQNVPSNGTLTYTGGSKDKDLTKSNVKSNRYTTKNSGSYRLAQLTYTGTKGKDTIDYIAYSGSTAQFTGKVVFNGTAAVPTDVVVTYGSTGGQAVRFSQNDFVSANSAMSKATKVRFVAPANGTLLMNGANASGVDIATTLLGTVTYQPKSGFNGQDKIIFAAYDASNNTVASGTVNVTVIGNPTTGTTPGGTPGGVSDVSQFKDVSATAWYRDNLATLVRKGIITGKGEGKFDPLGTVTYGEALKMVLESCGYTAALGTGSQWAINYKNLAVSRGWISSDIDLNAAISRNATAELTAKVLGVSAVTSGSPFADEANGYAAALYYTSPQIFAGSPNPNGGKPLFKNSSPLLRQEVCAVICRVSDYHTQHTTNNMPDGI